MAGRCGRVAPASALRGVAQQQRMGRLFGLQAVLHPGALRRITQRGGDAFGHRQMAPHQPEPGRELRLEAAQLAGLDDEARLRRLCAWVLEAELQQRRWELVLGALHIGPGGGAAQRRAALDALALWPGTGR